MTYTITDTNNRFFGLNQACSTAHLVYLRNYRCSSTLFYENFVNALRWVPLESKDIDWDNCLVFSHLADPIKRRHKGIAYWLIKKNLVEKFETDLEFQETISNSLYIDNHSASIYHMLGEEKVSKIKWIICDYNDHSLTLEATKNFLKSQYILELKNFNYGIELKHTSNYFGIQLQNLVEQKFLVSNNKNNILKYFEKDIELFSHLRKE